MKCLGYRGESGCHTLQERQGSVLTNQCLGNGTNAEQGAERSFLPHSDKLIRERDGSIVIMMMTI